MAKQAKGANRPRMPKEHTKKAAQNTKKNIATPNVVRAPLVQCDGGGSGMQEWCKSFLTNPGTHWAFLTCLGRRAAAAPDAVRVHARAGGRGGRHPAPGPGEGTGHRGGQGPPAPAPTRAHLVRGGSGAYFQEFQGFHFFILFSENFISVSTFRESYFCFREFHFYFNSVFREFYFCNFLPRIGFNFVCCA